MSTRRLGNTVFDDTDPLDDLRPNKGRKFIPPAAEEAPAEPEKVIDVQTRGTPETPASSATPAMAELALPAVGAPEPGEDEEENTVTAELTGAAKPKRQAKDEGQGKSPRKIRFSANISVSTKERADNAAYWVPGLNLSALTEMALEKELRKLEKEFNNGEPFKPAGSLKYGRPRS